MISLLRRFRNATFLSSALLTWAIAPCVWGQTPESAPTAINPSTTTGLNATAPPSDSAQRIYANAREQLVQVRTLLQGDNSQATVGSGFLVDASGLLITNYHVISTVALEPKRHRLVYTTSSGEEGPLELIAFDVVHDVALLRASSGALHGRAPLSFRPADLPLVRGERIFSLGNPLDVGFAVMEGNYNGLVERSFYPNIFFGGSLSSGMSGGPALDEAGRIIGVNVATRRDGEQISFLVPAEFAQHLLASSAKADPIANEAVYPEITRQLTTHQEALTERFIALPWHTAQGDGYSIPMPQEEFMRCWGRSSPEENKGMRMRMSDCSMDTQVFINGRFQISGIHIRHRLFDGSSIGPWRFAAQYSSRFEDEIYSSSGRRSERVPQECHEQFIEHEGLPMRAVICLNTYKKLPDLYRLQILLASVNQPEQGLISEFSVGGISFDNAMRLTEHLLKGFAWKN